MKIDEYTTKQVIKRLKEIIDNDCDGSQTVFANRIGVSKQFVSQCLRGINSPSTKTALKIGSEFHVNPLWVMGMSTEKYGIGSTTTTKPVVKQNSGPPVICFSDPSDPKKFSFEIDGEVLKDEEEIAVINAYRQLEDSQKVMIRRMLGI